MMRGDTGHKGTTTHQWRKYEGCTTVHLHPLALQDIRLHLSLK
jgi:hypothetical protein